MILESGQDEAIKALAHGVALGVGCILLGYNAAAWLYRRDTHLAVNALLYAGFVALETKHVAHHVKACHGYAE